MRVSEKILISEDMVKDFSELSGDKNPIHLDEEYAKSTIFGKRVAHGMLLSSFFSRLISEVYPGKGSIYLQQNLIFKNPCFINDEIEVIVELDKKDGNKFFLKTIIFKDDEILIEGNAIILKK
jgi:3-hydroxybutyryl-CoA dehydratase